MWKVFFGLLSFYLSVRVWEKLSKSPSISDQLGTSQHLSPFNDPTTKGNRLQNWKHITHAVSSHAPCGHLSPTYYTVYHPTSDELRPTTQEAHDPATHTKKTISHPIIERSYIALCPRSMCSLRPWSNERIAMFARLCVCVCMYIWVCAYVCLHTRILHVQTQTQNWRHEWVSHSEDNACFAKQAMVIVRAFLSLTLSLPPVHYLTWN